MHREPYTLTCNGVVINCAKALDLFPAFWDECERRSKRGDGSLWHLLPPSRQLRLLAKRQGGGHSMARPDTLF